MQNEMIPLKEAENSFCHHLLIKTSIKETEIIHGEEKCTPSPRCPLSQDNLTFSDFSV